MAVNGPIQYIVFGVRTEDQQKEVVRQLRTASERGAIRVLDMAYIRKAEDGTLQHGRLSGLSEDEQRRYGTLARALIGMGAAMEFSKTGGEFGKGTFDGLEFGESVQEVKERIYDAAQDLPPGAACAIAVIEHRWLQELKENAHKQGVVVLAQGMVRPRSLLMLGAELQEAEQAAMH
ncbi:MAG TPA: hypothetical protein VKT82_06895 [Ktedonobacterales bacterium]|nr:hypothetical protein [Ktedonobacterales bacterium]